MTKKKFLLKEIYFSIIAIAVIFCGFGFTEKNIDEVYAVTSITVSVQRVNNTFFNTSINTDSTLLELKEAIATEDSSLTVANQSLYYDDNLMDEDTKALLEYGITSNASVLLTMQNAINYCDQGGDSYTGSTLSLTTYTEGVGAELESPTKTGFNFLGWTATNDVLGTIINSISTTEIGVKTLYAVWQEIAPRKDISEGTLSFKTESVLMLYKQGEGAYKAYTGSFTITGSSVSNTSATNTIIIENGEPYITLNNVHIGAGHRDTDLTDSSGDKKASVSAATNPINIINGAPTLLLIGDNKLLSANYQKAGIHVPQDASVTINGEGSLEVSCCKTLDGYQSVSAGIGGENTERAGTITLNAARIDAYALSLFAIGGYSSSSKNYIKSGTVTASTSRGDAVGISGSPVITGGVVRSGDWATENYANYNYNTLNAEGHPVYCVTLDIGAGNTSVSAMTFKINGEDYEYNMMNAKSLSSGLVHIYLPYGLATAFYNGTVYQATVTNNHTAVFDDIFTVSYEENGGTELEDEQYEYGTAFALPTADDISKTGHVFLGWTASDNYWNEVTNPYITEIPATEYGAKTYYAKWKAAEYSIHYYDQGETDLIEFSGTVETALPTKYTYGTSVYTADFSIPTKPGFAFIGWYKGYDTDSTMVVIANNSTGDINIYVKWAEKNYEYHINHVASSNYTVTARTTTPTLSYKIGTSSNILNNLIALIDADRYIEETNSYADCILSFPNSVISGLNLTLNYGKYSIVKGEFYSLQITLKDSVELYLLSGIYKADGSGSRALFRAENETSTSKIVVTGDTYVRSEFIAVFNITNSNIFVVGDEEKQPTISGVHILFNLSSSTFYAKKANLVTTFNSVTYSRSDNLNFIDVDENGNQLETNYGVWLEDITGYDNTLNKGFLSGSIINSSTKLVLKGNFDYGGKKTINIWDMQGITYIATSTPLTQQFNLNIPDHITYENGDVIIKDGASVSSNFTSQNLYLLNANNDIVIYSNSTLYLDFNYEDSSEILNINEATDTVKIVYAQNTFRKEDFTALSSFVLPIKQGYTFKGYFTTDTSTKLIDENGNLVLNVPSFTDENGWISTISSKYIRAQWEIIDYEICYYDQGDTDLIEFSGSVEPTLPSIYNYGTAIDFNELSTPKKLGFKFLGWYDGYNSNTQITIIEDDSIGNINMYAKWAEKTYEYSIDTNQSSKYFVYAHSKTIGLDYALGTATHALNELIQLIDEDRYIEETDSYADCTLDFITMSSLRYNISFNYGKYSIKNAYFYDKQIILQDGVELHLLAGHYQVDDTGNYKLFNAASETSTSKIVITGDSYVRSDSLPVFDITNSNIFVIGNEQKQPTISGVDSLFELTNSTFYAKKANLVLTNSGIQSSFASNQNLIDVDENGNQLETNYGVWLEDITGYDTKLNKYFENNTIGDFATKLVLKGNFDFGEDKTIDISDTCDIAYITYIDTNTPLTQHFNILLDPYISYQNGDVIVEDGASVLSNFYSPSKFLLNNNNDISVYNYSVFRIDFDYEDASEMLNLDVATPTARIVYGQTTLRKSNLADLPIFITPEKKGYIFKGFVINGTATKIIDKDGKLILNVQDYTDANGWINGSKIVDITASWEIHIYVFRVSSGEHGYYPSRPLQTSYTINTIGPVAPPTPIADVGYEFSGWEITQASGSWELGEFVWESGNYGYPSLTAMYEPLMVGYVVKHYIENLDGEFELFAIENKSAYTDTQVIAEYYSTLRDAIVIDDNNPNTINGLLISGNGSSVFELYYKLVTYSISWKNGIFTKTNTAKYGAMPQYKGITPSKESDGEYSYKFIGWTPEIRVVTGDASYEAVFEKELICLIGEATTNNKPNMDAEIVFSEGIDEDTKFSLRTIAQGNLNTKIEIPSQKQVIGTYTAALTQNGRIVKNLETDKMIVKFKAPKEVLNKQNVKIALLDKNNKTILMSTFVQGDYLVFETDSLGDFAIIADAESCSLWLWILLAVIVLVLLIVVFIAKRKVTFVVDGKKINKIKLRINQKIIVPTTLTDYTWFKDKKLTKPFTQTKMKLFCKTAFGKLSDDKSTETKSKSKKK